MANTSPKRGNEYESEKNCPCLTAYIDLLFPGDYVELSHLMITVLKNPFLSKLFTYC